MTAKTTFYINQLPRACRKHLDALKAIGKVADDKAIVLSQAEIRGYLIALNDTGVISDAMFRTLYIYYTRNSEV